MKAEDTVMSADRKDQLINMATKLTDPMPLLEVMRFGDTVAEEQAEISFKAGFQQCAMDASKSATQILKHILLLTDG